MACKLLDGGTLGMMTSSESSWEFSIGPSIGFCNIGVNIFSNNLSFSSSSSFLFNFLFFSILSVKSTAFSLSNKLSSFSIISSCLSLSRDAFDYYICYIWVRGISGVLTSATTRRSSSSEFGSSKVNWGLYILSISSFTSEALNYRVNKYEKTDK